ncbi:hypothetical protein SEA_DATBOI_114 [Gordonia phage DatBoi]|nr:hypothetical protein SEA_DATBOI_114 [Gordonia phage DatBoi]
MQASELKAQVLQYAKMVKTLVALPTWAVGPDYNDEEPAPDVNEDRVDRLIDAGIISSAVVDIDGDLTGRHRVLLDLDVPAMLVPSTTAGHSHLIIDKKIEWQQYMAILNAFAAARIVEPGYALASKKRLAGHLRTPWTLKPDVEVTPERRALAEAWKAEIQKVAD